MKKFFVFIAILVPMALMAHGRQMPWRQAPWADCPEGQDPSGAHYPGTHYPYAHSQAGDTLSRKGFLNVQDTGGAVGATVFVDGEAVGKVPLARFPVEAGEHVLTFQKEGYLSRKKELHITVLAGRETTASIGQGRTAPFRFASVPAGAEVYIDGNLVGKTPYECRLGEGRHRIRIESPGLLPYDETIPIKKSDDLREVSIDLNRVRPITIDCEDDSLYVEVRKGKQILSQGKKTPARLNLPHSEQDYTLRIYRPNVTHPVYWGPMQFNDDGKTVHTVRTHNFSQFHILTAEIQTVDAGNRRIALHDPQAVLFRCAYFPGVTFPFIKGATFSKDEVPSIGSMFRKDGFLLGVSLLTNIELRIGGHITDYADVAALGTFSWYPDWTRVIPELAESIPFLTSGIDGFAGIEFSSRVPVFLGKLKVGCQWLRLNGLPAARNEKPHLVVSLAFSLGDKHTWGENIIRLF